MIENLNNLFRRLDFSGAILDARGHLVAAATHKAPALGAERGQRAGGARPARGCPCCWRSMRLRRQGLPGACGTGGRRGAAAEDMELGLPSDTM